MNEERTGNCFRQVVHIRGHLCALVTVIVPLLGGHVQVNQHILSMGMFDVNLEIDNEGRLKTKRYEKRDDFNFPFISRNIPVASA
jgi:hypothetical protein